MSIPNHRERGVRPTHPGELLRERRAVDLWDVAQEIGNEVDQIEPVGSS